VAKYYTVSVVAEIFHRKERTIYRWIKEGFILNVRRVKDGYLIPSSEVERVLEESKLDPYFEK